MGALKVSVSFFPLPALYSVTKQWRPQPCWAACVVLIGFMRDCWKSMQETGRKWLWFWSGPGFQPAPRDAETACQVRGWILHVTLWGRLDSSPCLPNHTWGLQPHRQHHGPDSTSLQSQYHQYFSSHVSHLGLPLPPPGPKSPCQPELQFRERAVRGKEERMMPRGAKGRQGTTARCCYVTAAAVAWMKNTGVPNVH